MANTAGLKIVLSADLGNTIQALGQVSKQLGNTGTAFQAFSKSTGQLPVQSIDQFRKSVTQLKTELGTGFKPLANLFPPASVEGITKASAALKGIKPSGNEAALALTNVGRVAQDLPFGFIGIQNNLNPLLESFVRLKKETGSTGGALKALGSSLVGAGGVGLALSVVSSAILIYQNGIAGFNQKTKEAKIELEGFSKALQEANSQAGDEKSRLIALTTIAQDNTRSIKDRTDAVLALQKEMPETFSQLSREKILNGDLTPAIEATTKAIIDRAKARAVEARISDLSARDLDIDIKREEIARKLVTAENELAKSKKYQDVRGAVADVGFASINAERAVTSLKDELLDLNKQSIGVGEELLRLTNRIKTEDLKVDLKVQTPKTTKVNVEDDPVLKRLKEDLDKYQKQLEVTNKIREAGLLPINRENDALQLQLNIIRSLNDIDAREVKLGIKTELEIDPTLNDLEVQKALKDYSTRQASPIKIPISVIPELKIDTQIVIPDNIIPDNAFDAVINKMKAQAAAAKEQITTIAVDLAPAINQAFEGAAEAVGTGIGNLISGFGADGLLNGFANTLSDLIATVGRLLIKAGVQFVALKKLALSITTPGGAVAAIAGGIAALAIAQQLKASVNNIKPRPFATGGLVTSPTVGLIGEAGPEVVIPLDKLGSLLGRSDNQNINITGQLIADGRGIVANLSRWEKSAKRL